MLQFLSTSHGVLPTFSPPGGSPRRSLKPTSVWRWETRRTNSRPDGGKPGATGSSQHEAESLILAEPNSSRQVVGQNLAVTNLKLRAGFDEALAELNRRGLLLVHDNAFPSLTRLTIGEAVRGSWWAHPLSNDVYMVSQRLQHCGEVAMIKLVSGKETYLHRQWWPHLVAIGISRQAWQLDGLPGSASELLAEVDRLRSIRLDRFGGPRRPKETREDARSLAGRLLVYADDVHTESGAHARRLESWPSWAQRHEVALSPLPSVDEARRELERIVDSSNAECSSEGFLPWRKKARTSSRRPRPS